MSSEPDVAPSRRRGRPSAPVLSRTKITGAAMALVHARGYRALTMAGLARQLKVAPSALYNHVASKDDVLRWVQDRVNSAIDADGFRTLAWDEALVRWARSYRAAYARHAPLVALMAVTPITGAPHTVAMYERVASGLCAAGWPEDEVIAVITAVESFVLGSALDTTAPEDIFDVGDLALDAPVLAAVNRARPTGDVARQAFDLGLAALVEGLRARLTAVGTTG